MSEPSTFMPNRVAGRPSGCRRGGRHRGTGHHAEEGSEWQATSVASRIRAPLQQRLHQRAQRTGGPDAFQPASRNGCRSLCGTSAGTGGWVRAGLQRIDLIGVGQAPTCPISGDIIVRVGLEHRRAVGPHLRRCAPASGLRLKRLAELVVLVALAGPVHRFVPLLFAQRRLTLSLLLTMRLLGGQHLELPQKLGQLVLDRPGPAVAPLDLPGRAVLRRDDLQGGRAFLEMVKPEIVQDGLDWLERTRGSGGDADVSPKLLQSPGAFVSPEQDRQQLGDQGAADEVAKAAVLRLREEVQSATRQDRVI